MPKTLTISTAVKIERSIGKACAASHSTAGDNFDDASNSSQVTASLLSQRSTTELKPKVSIADGVVVLKNIDQNDAANSEVTKIGGDHNGVTSVTNNIT